MIGLINNCLEKFVITSHGQDTWNQILAASGVTCHPWVSSCGYADHATYDIVRQAAKQLGITWEEALEGCGTYFISYACEQGYSKLLKALGSDFVDFLHNLNSLHLHLLSSFPAMRAPSFRCTKVTPTSLELHYYSSRPCMWPLAVGLLKGLSREQFGFEVSIELLQARGRSPGADHEVFLVSYPPQALLNPPPEVHTPVELYDIHPFHLLIDQQCRLLQHGKVLGRLLPNMRRGMHMTSLFTISIPHLFAGFTFEGIKLELHSPFLLTSKQLPSLNLKGQMILQPGSRPGIDSDSEVLLFLGTPRCSNLDELQACHLFLSDLPLHDVSRDFLLLYEQRQLEAELKERLERTTTELKAEKARAEALVQRMSVLLSCFPETSSGARSAAHSNRGLAAAGGPECEPGTASCVDNAEVIAAVRESVLPQVARDGAEETLQVLEMLSEGTFGKVYRGLWHGSEVAIKTMILPSNMSGADKREKMAIMEAAISISLSHPNVVQTYTYDIQPIRDTCGHQGAPSGHGSSSKEELSKLGIVIGMGSHSNTFFSMTGNPLSLSRAQPPLSSGERASVSANEAAVGGSHGGGVAAGGGGSHASSGGLVGGGSIHSYEVRLVLEMCDLGSLRECLDRGMLITSDNTLNYHAVLDAAIDAAKAMVHLHRQNVLHSDLKSRNIMMKSSGEAGRQAVAKVGDFGLSVRIQNTDTHLSCMFQGTLNHMAPEVLLEGRISKAADVYSFGILLWELYTGDHAFQGVPRALLGHQVTVEDRRPVFPIDAPLGFCKLVEWCWSRYADSRPTFVEVLSSLQKLRNELGGPTPFMQLRSAKQRLADGRPADSPAGGPPGPNEDLHLHKIAVGPASPVGVRMQPPGVSLNGSGAQHSVSPAGTSGEEDGTGGASNGGTGATSGTGGSRGAPPMASSSTAAPARGIARPLHRLASLTHAAGEEMRMADARAKQAMAAQQLQNQERGPTTRQESGTSFLPSDDSCGDFGQSRSTG